MIAPHDARLLGHFSDEVSSVTIDALVSLDPELGRLRAEVRAYQPSRFGVFCRLTTWANRFDRRLRKLAGHGRRSGPFQLQTSRALTALRSGLRDEMADCRGRCWCKR